MSTPWRSLAPLAFFALSSLLAGCDPRLAGGLEAGELSGDSEAPSSIEPSPALSASASSAAPQGSAAPAEPVPDEKAAPAQAPAAHASEAEPAWPETKPGDTLRLTWVLYPWHEDPKGLRVPSRAVELVARVGSVTRRMHLGVASGGLFSNFQTICNDQGLTGSLARQGHEVATLTFYQGGGDTFRVVRKKTDTLTVERSLWTDGACMNKAGEMIACPSQDRVLLSFAIPPGVEITEAIVEVEGKGKEHPFRCFGD